MRLLSTLFFLLISSILIAQEANIPEPEFLNRPYYLEEGELKGFEKIDGVIDIKVKAMGYGGSDTFYTAFNSESTKRFTNNNFPRIFVKLESGIDPEEVITILKKDKKRKKNRRRFKIGSRKLFGKARNTNSNIISFDIIKIRNQVYEIIIDTELKPDEYAFAPMSKTNTDLLSASTSVKMYCFGID